MAAFAIETELFLGGDSVPISGVEFAEICTHHNEVTVVAPQIYDVDEKDELRLNLVAALERVIV